MQVTQEQFEELVSAAIDDIPEKYRRRLANVAFVIEDEPDAEQRRQLGLRGNQSLFGLYEGVPLTRRGGSESLLLPDKITLFKLPIARHCETPQQLREQIRHTVWHEVAHFFGLDHAEIFERETNA